MAYSITKQDSEETYGYKEYRCSTEADVPNIPTDGIIGSELFVREGPEVYFLDIDPATGQKVWMKPED